MYLSIPAISDPLNWDLMAHHPLYNLPHWVCLYMCPPVSATRYWSQGHSRPVLLHRQDDGSPSPCSRTSPHPTAPEIHVQSLPKASCKCFGYSCFAPLQTGTWLCVRRGFLHPNARWESFVISSISRVKSENKSKKMSPVNSFWNNNIGSLESFVWL